MERFLDRVLKLIAKLFRVSVKFEYGQAWPLLTVLITSIVRWNSAMLVGNYEVAVPIGFSAAILLMILLIDVKTHGWTLSILAYLLGAIWIHVYFQTDWSSLLWAIPAYFLIFVRQFDAETKQSR